MMVKYEIHGGVSRTAAGYFRKPVKTSICNRYYVKKSTKKVLAERRVLPAAKDKIETIKN